jgi:hypothetical protein
MKQKPTSGLVKERGQVPGIDGSASRAEPEQVAEPDEPKSRYSIEECRRFAEWGFRNGSVSNPLNYARAIQRSGCVESSIERFLWEEKLRLDSERELAVIQTQHKREVEELEKAVGQAMRAWAAERAARVREQSFAGALLFFSVVILSGALWIGLGRWVVAHWRAARQAPAVLGPASDRAGQRRSPAPGASPSASQTNRDNRVSGRE